MSSPNPFLKSLVKLRNSVWNYARFAVPVTLAISEGCEATAPSMCEDIVRVTTRIARGLSLNESLLVSMRPVVSTDDEPEHVLPTMWLLSMVAKANGSFSVGNDKVLGLVNVVIGDGCGLDDEGHRYDVDNAIPLDAVALVINVDDLIHDEEAWRSFKSTIEDVVAEWKDREEVLSVVAGLSDVLKWSGRLVEPKFYNLGGEPVIVDDVNKFLSLIQAITTVPVAYMVGKYLVVTVPFVGTYADFVLELNRSYD